MLPSQPDIFNANRMVFSSFEELRQSLVGWDTDPVQLGTGTLTTRFDQLQLGGTVIYRLRNDKLLADKSAHGDGELAYVVCFTWKRWCGFEVPPGSIVIKGPRREHRSVLGDDWESLTIHVTDEVADELGLPINSANYFKTPIERCVRVLPVSLLDDFRSLTDGLMVPFGAQAESANNREWARATCDRALCLLVRAFRAQSIEEPIRPATIVTGYDLVVSALACFEGLESGRVSVTDLADAAGVTTRSLNNAFRNYIGVSPNQYLLARRLKSAREALLSSSLSDDPPDVTSVALSQEFYHLSRFAQHYHRLFGELPSQTLYRARAIATT